jgi:hypothetical protein
VRTSSTPWFTIALLASASGLAACGSRTNLNSLKGDASFARDTGLADAPNKDAADAGTTGDADASSDAAGDAGTTISIVPAFGGCSGLRVALGGAFVYWTDAVRGIVMRRPKAGGVETTVAGFRDKPTDIRVFGDAVYWIDEGAKALVKAPVAGGAATVVATSPMPNAHPDTSPGINGFTVGPDGTVYFSSGRRIYAVSAAGGAPVAVVEHPGAPDALALDGTTMVYTAGPAVGPWAAPLKAGQTTACGAALDADEGYVCQVAVNRNLVTSRIFAKNDRAYWVVQTEPPVLRSAPTTPGHSIRQWDSMASFQGGAPQAFTVAGDVAFIAFGPSDDRNAYIAQAALVPGSKANELVRVRSPKALAFDWSVTSIDADDTHVFWSTYESSGAVTESWCAIEGIERRR